MQQALKGGVSSVSVPLLLSAHEYARPMAWGSKVYSAFYGLTQEAKVGGLWMSMIRPAPHTLWKEESTWVRMSQQL